MTKDQLLARIAQMLATSSQRPGSEQPERLVAGALTLLLAVYGEGSQQIKTLLKRIGDIAKLPDHRRPFDIASAVQGSLLNLQEEVQGGLLSSLERRITSDVLSDLIQLARVALDEQGDNAKNVAAVLVAAAYEDTLRRIAKEHAGVIGQDRLENIIGKLKDAGLLVAPQVGIAQSHLSFRNRALHAQWETIDESASRPCSPS